MYFGNPTITERIHFAIMKKRRMFAEPGTTIDDIVESYGNN